MVSAAIKKYADSHGMTVDGGLAYGKVNGMHISLEDGSNGKILQIYLAPPAQAAEDTSDRFIRAQQVLMNADVKEYHLEKSNPVTVSAGRAIVTFRDSVGVMKHVESYIDEIMPKLTELDLAGDCCAYCGSPMEQCAYASLDGYLFPVHTACIQTMTDEVAASEAKPKEGSVGKGVIGALLGAVIGAIPWAIVYMLGYVASWLGLLIGWLSNFLYGKLGGKNGRMRIVVVVAALLVGILLGQAGGTTLLFMKTYDEMGGQETVGYTPTEYLQICWDEVLYADQTKMWTDIYNIVSAEYDPSEIVTCEEFVESCWDDGYASDRAELTNAIAEGLALGLLFGLVGCAGLFSKMKKEHGKRQVRALK